MMKAYPLFITCKKTAFSAFIFISILLAVFAATETAHAFDFESCWQKYDLLPFEPTGITITPDGLFWFSSDDGAWSWDGESYTSYTSENSGLPANRITTMEISPDNAIWFGTAYGTARLKDDNWSVYTTDNSGVTDNYASHIAFDSAGNIWLANNWNISHFDGENWLNITTNINSLYEYSYVITDIAVDPNNELWVQTKREGLWHWTGNTWETYGKILGESVRSSVLVTKSNGNMVVVGYDIFEFDGATWIAQGTCKYHTTAVFDSSGTLWTAGWDNINLTNNTGTASLSIPQTPIGGIDQNNVDIILDMAVDNENTMWFVTRNGLFSFNGAIVGMPKDDPYSLPFEIGDDVNITWFSSRPSTVNLDYQVGNAATGTWHELVRDIESSGGKYPMSLEADMIPEEYVRCQINFKLSSDNAYVSNDLSACWFERSYYTDAFANYNLEFEFNESGIVTCITEDGDGTLWAGSLGQQHYLEYYDQPGIWRFDGYAWTLVDMESIDPRYAQLDNRDVLAASTDSNGNPWFALSNGVVADIGGIWQSYLAEHYVAMLSADNQGRIWAVTADTPAAPYDSLYTLYCIENNTIVTVQTPWDDRVDGITAIGVSPLNKLYIYRSGELWEYSDTTWQEVESIAGNMPLQPVKLTWDTDGNLKTYDTTPYSYLYTYSFNTRTWSYFPKTWDQPMITIQDIAFEDNGKEWYIFNQELLGFDGTEYDYSYYHYYGWQFSSISTIYIDRNGTKWLGYQGGIYSLKDVTVAVEEQKHHPGQFMLLPVYPNPFNPATTITYTLPAPTSVSLTVYSITGQRIATLVDELMAAGTHAVQFDGAGLASGVYFARLEAGNTVETRKMLLVK